MRLRVWYLKIGLGIVAAAVLVIAFHDFIIYPQDVRKDCNDVALRWIAQKASVDNPQDYVSGPISDGYRFKYETCIHEKGY